MARTRMGRFLLLAVVAISTVGCGGGPSANDMKRLSRRRSSPAEAPAPAPAATPAPAPAETKTPAGVPAPMQATTPAPATPMPAAPQVAVNSAPVAPPEVTKPQPKPAEPLPPISIANAKPARSLDEAERWFRSTRNLEKIGAAMKEYLAKNKTLPGSRFRAGLSWRVELLPYLGYENLYRHFDLDSSWDAPQNLELLKHIPPEFQSPERFDEKTNYLRSAGQGCCNVPVALDQFEDPPMLTVVVVEADDDRATPWTRPAEHVFELSAPRKGLGKLRPEGILALFGGFQVFAIPPTNEKDLFIAYFTHQGTDNSPLDRLLQPERATIHVSAKPAVAVTETPTAKPEQVTATADMPSVAELPASLTAARPDGRTIPPDDETQRQITQTFREVYQEDLAAARRPEDRAKLVTKLLGETSRLEGDDAAFYVLNDLVRKMAAAVGDLPSFSTAVKNLDDRYQVDGIALRLEGLTQMMANFSKSPEALTAIARAVEVLVVDAIARDDFNAALKAVDLQRSIALRRQDKTAINEAAARRQDLEAARSAFREAATAVKTLDAKPGDAKASEVLGRYLTLVKNDWETGLPLLAKADDVRLRFVATIDGEPEKSPANTVILGDKWWELGDDLKTPFRRGAYLRAAHWYEIACGQLPAGIQKVRAEQRLAQMRKHFPELSAAKPVSTNE